MASISRNSLYLLSGSVVQKILAFIYFVFLARFLGPIDIGKYSFAISFVAVFSIFLDLGINQIIIREAAKDDQKAKNYFYNATALRLLCALIIYGLIILAVNILQYPLVTKIMVYLAGIFMVSDSFANLNYSFLRGRQNLRYEGFGLPLYQFVLLVLGLLVLVLRLPLPYIILPSIIASFINFIFGSIFLRKIGVLFKCSFKIEVIKELLKITLPFFWAGLFGTIFSYIDIVLLSKLSSDVYVGFYSAAGKIPGGLRMFAIALAAALYPAACYYFKSNKEELGRIIHEAIFYLLLFTVPLIFGLWILADQAINILYGEKFLAAVASLRILAWSIIFVFLDYIFYAVLNACGREKRNAANRAIAMFTIIILNLIFIPNLRDMGSSIAFTLSFALLAVLGAYWTNKTINFQAKELTKKLAIILTISIIMGAIMLFLKSIFVWPVILIIGVLVYGLGVWWVGLIRPQDKNHLKELFRFLKLRS